MTQLCSYTLVTGASSGIGRAICQELAPMQPLILHGRDRHKLEQTLALCQGADHLIWCYDLEQVDDVQAAFETFVTSQNLSISGFVHSAGVVSVMAARTMTPAACARIMNTNFTSAMLLVASLCKKKIAKETLRNIVFISALISRYGCAAHCLYAASKGALDGAMRSLALELAPQVRVNSVCPGAVDTAMSSDVLAGNDERIALLNQYPLGIGKPEDIAAMVGFLLSKKSAWITGQQFFVDGGRSANMSLR